MRNLIELVGRLVMHFLTEMGRVSFLFYNVLKKIISLPVEWQIIAEQMIAVGIRSIPVVLITALFTGMVLALQTYTGFRRFGAESLVGTVVALSMTREMGPVLTALIVAGRAGAAMAAELGTMRVTEQIDALETLATDPVKYLVVPRFLSGIVMLPALAVLTDIVGILGGYIITVGLFGVGSTSYWKRTWDYLKMDDVYNGLIKACFFGAFISIISCYKGFYTSGGAEGVGKATTGAVVLSSMSILIGDYFLSVWLF
ncbi:putative phospholipid ABC transporter permease protein MlaE [bacterium BMS3Bbin05]|nr:putative phospholipid ABC transporter permease protein MlaE [bacterium BMS3Bbin05]